MQLLPKALPAIELAEGQVLRDAVQAGCSAVHPHQDRHFSLTLPGVSLVRAAHPGAERLGLQDLQPRQQLDLLGYCHLFLRGLLLHEHAVRVPQGATTTSPA